MESIFQQNVIKFVKEKTNKSLVINAKAGAGKTTLAVKVAKIVANDNKSVAMFAFNRSIANELKERMGSVCYCDTMHAHGYSAIRAYLGRKQRVNINAKKWLNYIKLHINTLTQKEFENGNQLHAFASQCVSLLDLCRINFLKGNESEKIEDLILYHGLSLDTEVVGVVAQVLSKCYTLDSTEIDFVDMIVLPTTDCKLRKKVTKYDFVIVDECQDLNKAQQELMLATIAKGGRFMAVGDPNQAINGFCGADADSFNHLVELADGNVLPLSVCYRCGNQIITAAQKYVADIQANEGACDGLVERRNDLNGIMIGDMVICRKSAPLIGLCLKMIANGKSAVIKGKDIAEGLKKLIEKLKPTNQYDLLIKLDEELEKIRKNLEKHGIKGNETEHCPSVCNFQDKIDCIKVLAENTNSVSDIISKLDTLFEDTIKGNVVMLSTIHKAKGLESNRVHIIAPEKLPLIWKDQLDWQYQQELNLCYVAITRAKKELYYIDLNEKQIATYQF